MVCSVQCPGGSSVKNCLCECYNPMGHRKASCPGLQNQPTKGRPLGSGHQNLGIRRICRSSPAGDTGTGVWLMERIKIPPPPHHPTPPHPPPPPRKQWHLQALARQRDSVSMELTSLHPRRISQQAPAPQADALLANEHLSHKV